MTMVNNTKYRRGSEWRKWDLHLHSLHSNRDLMNGYKGVSEDDFIKQVKESDLEVVGLTNYFRFRDEDFALKTKLERNGIITFLNLEIRLDYQNSAGECCDFHIIFDNELEKAAIQRFLENLTVKIGIEQKKAIQLSGEDDYKKGVVNFEHLIEKLDEKSLNLKERYLTGFLSRGKGNARSSAVYEGIAENSNLLIHSTNSPQNIEKDRDFWLQKDKPLVQASDAHQISNIGIKYTWIKADPTFNGLKQIIYEPVERLKIQENNPSFEYNKPYFSKIEIKDQVGIFAPSQDQVNFHKTVLPLNKNLVAMIGGRGTGKSMLVDYWGNIFGKNTEEDKGFSSDPHFSIEYSKENVEDTTTVTYDGGNDNHLDFIYIPQSNLKKVSNKNSIDQEVKKLLGLEELHFSKKLTAEIQAILENIDKLSSWFMEEDEDGRRLNNKDYVEAIRTQSQALLDSITTKSNKEKLEKYTDNISAIQALKNNLDYLDRLQLRLESFRKELSEEIAEAHRRFPESDGYKELTTLDFNAQLYGISENRKIAEARKASKESENEAIKSDFEKEGLTGDLSNLLKNAGTHQSWVVWAKGQLKEIEKRKLILENLRNQRDGLATKLKEEYEIQKREIDKAWMNILERHEGQQHKRLIRKILLREDKTSVEGEIVFNEKKFYDKLLEIVDRRSYRDTNALRKHFEISSFEDWVNFVNSDLKKFIDDGAEAEKFPGIKELFFGLKERATYLKTLPKITHNGKRLNLLSVGQRGTVYLCLKLATDAFSTPIIFDQPEDDLDNEFIVAELIDIFRELKEYRQIIIVTHNANLVVNADAEQVIIASNDNEILTYKSGSLENENIIDGVCKILEGGVEAFEKRKHKYRFD